VRLILSRKGFDASNGGCASPVLPSGEMYSLPIPVHKPGEEIRRYDEILAGTRSLGALVADLTKGRTTGKDYAHLDPDLERASLKSRPAEWCAVFGQRGASQTHLSRMGVKEGDIFVFFGWFRRVEEVNGRYIYVIGAPNWHVIFGWLQVGRSVSVHNEDNIPTCAKSHQHYLRMKRNPRRIKDNDTLYISSEKLDLPGARIDRPGGGTFKTFKDALRLTAPGQPCRNTWQLPAWFYPYAPANQRESLSYHGKRNAWTLDGDHVLLKTRSPGQEFVLDCREYPEAVPWLARLFELD
jgi:hypothetical protein